MSVREEHTQVVSSCDTWEASNTVQQASPASLDKFGLQVAAGELAPGMQTPSTVLVWIDGAWNGHAVSCKSISAGAVRLRNHATGTPKVDQWETLDHRWKQDCKVDENSETHGAGGNKTAGSSNDTAEQAIPVIEEVPDAIDSLGKEVKYAKKSKEQFPGPRKALESSTQKAAIAHERRRLAEEAIPVSKSAFVDPGLGGREPPETVPQEQTTFESAKENLSDLDTKVLESEAMLNRVSKAWSCHCDQSTCCDLEHTSAVELPWLHLWTGSNSQCERRSDCEWALVQASERHDDWNGGNDWLDFHSRGEYWSTRSSRVNDAGLACGHEQVQRLESTDAAQR